jgi:hypothetical protein
MIYVVVAFALIFVSFPAPSTTAAGDEARTLYITPTGGGSRDGSSWTNAGNLSSLPAFVARAGPGGRIYLRAQSPSAMAVRRGVRSP